MIESSVPRMAHPTLIRLRSMSGQGNKRQIFVVERSKWLDFVPRVVGSIPGDLNIILPFL